MNAKYNIIFLKNRFEARNSNLRVQENVIRPPNVCPFCSEREALDKINFYYGKKRNYYIKLCVCKKHSILKSRILIKPFLIATTPVLVLLILTIMLPKFPILYIVIFCCFTSVIVPSLFRIYGNFWIEFFKNESVIYVRSNDGYDEFLKLNKEISRTFSGDLRPYEKIKVKVRKLKLISWIILILTVFPLILSLALNWRTLFASLCLFFVIYFLLYALVDFKLYKKGESVKRDILFPTNE